jgi:peptidoglycan hydrolase CwlO-like protein
MDKPEREKIISDTEIGYIKSKIFILNNYKTIIKVGVALFLLYWVIFILTPNVKMSADAKAKIEALDSHIDSLQSEQKKLEEGINIFNKEVLNIDKKISNIKQEKTIIKEIYHEKINSVDNYSIDELDSFFAERYGYSY